MASDGNADSEFSVDDIKAYRDELKRTIQRIDDCVEHSERHGMHRATVLHKASARASDDLKRFTGSLVSSLEAASGQLVETSLRQDKTEDDSTRRPIGWIAAVCLFAAFAGYQTWRADAESKARASLIDQLKFNQAIELATLRADRDTRLDTLDAVHEKSIAGLHTQHREEIAKKDKDQEQLAAALERTTPDADAIVNELDPDDPIALAYAIHVKRSAEARNVARAKFLRQQLVERRDNGPDDSADSGVAR